MKKRLLAIFLCIAFSIPVFSVSADGDFGIYYSENFSSYAENAREFGNMSAVTGVDTRIINDNGNKVFFGRAWGEPVKTRVSLTGAGSGKTIMSANIKITGGNASGSLFAITYGSAKYGFLQYTAKRELKLADGYIAGGFPEGVYKRVTVAADWNKSLFSVYVDKKCIIRDWVMPSSISRLPDKVEWSIVNTDDTETDFYMDDVRIYDGDVLPWNFIFEAGKENNEILPFTPTESIETKSETLRNIEFNDGKTGGISIAGAECKVTAETDDDGTGFARFIGNTSGGNSYFDIFPTGLGETGKFVVDLRFKVNSMLGGASVGILDGKNASGKWLMGFEIMPGGTIKSRITNENLATYKTGTWTKYSFKYNIPEGKADIYSEGNYLTTVSIAEGEYPTFFRFDIYAPAGSTNDIQFDYIRVYSGKELLGDEKFTSGGSGATVTEVPANSVMDPVDKLNDALRGKTVFMTTNNKMYIDGKKQSYANESFKPYIINGAFMMPRNMYSLFSFDDVVFDENTGEISIGTRAKMKVGEKTYILDGVSRELNAAPELHDRTLYFPLRAVAEQLLNKKVSWDVRGMIIISDDPVETYSTTFLDRQIQWTPANLIYRYMQYDNPTGAEFFEKLKENMPQDSHPRVILTQEDVDYIRSEIKTDEEFMKSYKEAISQADYEIDRDYTKLANPSPEMRQSSAHSLHIYLKRLATAYLLTGDTKYAKKGSEIMLDMCKWESLNYKTSNLIAAHWGFAIAECYDSFYNYLNSSEEGRESLRTVREAVKKLVVEPHVNFYSGATDEMRYPFWQDNFPGLCASSVIVLLCAIGADDSMKAEEEYVLENSIRALENFTSLFAPDGGYYEGVSYEDYAALGFVPALNTLWNCCGTDFNIGTARGFSQSGYPFVFLQSPDLSFNFHDADSYFMNNSVAEFMGWRYNDPLQAEMMYTAKKAANASISLEAYYYYKKATDGKNINYNDGGLDRYFEASSSGGFKSSIDDPNSTFGGYHGGWTGIPHDMLDLGEFVFAADNTVWACDMGKDDYNLKDYFSMKEYVYYRKRPEGENCVVINPSVDSDTYYGQKIRAEAKLIKSDLNKSKGAYAVLDLSEAYERDVNQYHRGFYFGDDRNTYLIQDEISLKKSSELYWFMHTQQNIEILSNNKARLTSADGKSCMVDVYCSAPNFKLSSMPAEPLPSSPQMTGEKDRSSYRKLAIHAENVSGNVTVAVKLSPETGFYKYTGIDFVPIDSWNVPDGKRAAFPRIKNVYMDGKALSITESSKEVRVSLPFGTEKAPDITVETTAGTAQVIQAASIDDNAFVKITGEGVIERNIKIVFSVSADRDLNITENLSDALPAEGAKGTLIVPKRVWAASVPELQNPPEAIIDNDFSTSGTQEGKNKWFEFDLGEVMDISGISIIFKNGDIRQAIYDILYSEDGYNFTKVFSGKSTGNTSSWESTDLPGRVRYIRFVGNGNTSSSWNNITEFRAFK